MGRPSKYNEEIAEVICETIATSNKSVRAIALEVGLAMSTIFKWISENESFSERYARAKDMQADFLAEEIIEIADDSSQDLKGTDEHGNPIENREFVNRSRLRVDARKWIASKLKPKKYGEKLDITSEGEKIKPDLSMLPTDTLKALINANRKPDSEGA